MNQTSVILTADRLSADLTVSLLDRIKQMAKPFKGMSERDQEILIFDIEHLVENLIRQTVEIVAADGRHVVKAIAKDVKRAASSKNIEAKFVISGEDELRHALFDSVGFPAFIVLADAEQYLDADHGQEAEPDEPGLFGNVRQVT